MLTSCDHRYWSKGFRQPKDLAMPEFMWGEYLPGDEPGYMCNIDEDYCQNDIKQCPLWKQTDTLCEACEAVILTDGEILYCPYCEEEK